MQNGHRTKLQDLSEHAASAAGHCSAEESWDAGLSGPALSGALREWIDRVIVPVLIQDYIRESQLKPCPRLSVARRSGTTSGQSDEAAK